MMSLLLSSVALAFYLQRIGISVDDAEGSGLAEKCGGPIIPGGCHAVSGMELPILRRCRLHQMRT